MSEDADLVIPRRPTRYRSQNVKQLELIPSAIREVADVVGIELVNFDGERWETQAHGLWEARYESALVPPTASVVVVEAALRPVLLAPRAVALHQLLPSGLMPGYDDAYCWALDFMEVCAEKVRAAFTREEPQLRDFYDLGLLAGTGVDMRSSQFVALVDAKLDEVNAPPLAEQPAAFGLTGTRRVTVEGGAASLTAVVRVNEPQFQLDDVLQHYDQLWAKA